MMIPTPLEEKMAKRLSFFDHPRTEWPDELIASTNYKKLQYREQYLSTARVLVNMVREHDAAIVGLSP